MKLRIHHNSIRLRLDHDEVRELADKGRVEDRIVFGPEAALVYAIESHTDEEIALVRATGEITIRLPEADIKEWAASELVGFEATAENGESGLLILVEKDLPCEH